MVHRACMATFNGRQFMVCRDEHRLGDWIQHTRRCGKRRRMVVGIRTFVPDSAPQATRLRACWRIVQAVAVAKRRIELALQFGPRRLA